MLICLADVLELKHPANLLGFHVPQNWKHHRDPWPAPLVWALNGHSIRWLARELSLPFSTVYGWFRGNLPPLTRLWELGDLLKVEVAELVPTKRMAKDERLQVYE